MVIVRYLIKSPNSYSFVLVFSCLCISLSGQKGTEVGGWLGTGLYFGDLNTNFRFNRPGYAGGAVLRYNFNERVSIKGALSYAKLSADDRDSPNAFERERNINFHTNVIDVTGHLEFNFLPYIHGSKDEYYTPYIAVGASLARFNPKTNIMNAQGDQTTVGLQTLGTEGQLPGEEYALISPAFSIGFGFKFDINIDWSINIEISTRQLMTDYFDDVSGVYADPLLIDGFRENTADLSASQIADPSPLSNFGIPGKQRGNQRDNDNYTFIGVSIMKYFGTLQCPKPRTTRL